MGSGLIFLVFSQGQICNLSTYVLIPPVTLDYCLCEMICSCKLRAKLIEALSIVLLMERKLVEKTLKLLVKISFPSSLTLCSYLQKKIVGPYLQPNF